MALSASNIRNRSFSQGLRGLDKDEVYAFLDDVADRWTEMASRIETLEAKLTEIGDTANKVQATKERAEALQEELHTKEQRLDEREQELNERQGRLETKEAKLRSIADRLQDTLREETQALSTLADGGSSSTDAPADTADESDSKSTEEWVDSLFPNRLPGKESAAASVQDETSSEDEAEEDLSASESQFEAIKQDVQGMGEESKKAPVSQNGEEESESPPTEEMNQIWDVFDEQE